MILFRFAIIINPKFSLKFAVLVRVLLLSKDTMTMATLKKENI